MPRYIEANALNAAIEEWFDGVCVYDVSPSEAVNDFQSIVDEQPTVSPDEVRGEGKWTRHVLKNANTPWGYDCSACGEWFVIGNDTAERYNYCPSCGAKMEVE